jgi:methyltransferase family protein
MAGRNLDLRDYAARMSFRFVGPDDRPRYFAGVDHRLRKIGLSLEVLNTRLPADARRTRRAVAPLLRVPRLSTYPIGVLVNRAVASMPASSGYVNVGVWHGFTLLAGMAGNEGRRCIGIDNFSEDIVPAYGEVRTSFMERFERLRGPLHEFHELDYRDYFDRVHEGPIGAYLYDGEHSYANQLGGLEAAEPFFVPGSVVFVDDAFAPEAREATMTFVNRRQGEYEVIFDRATASKGHPTFWNGILVFRKLA